MADGPRHDPDGRDQPGFDWLYGTRRKGVGSSDADDATRVQPVQPDRAAGRPSQDPEPTRRLPTLDRPYQSPAPARRGDGGRPAGPAPVAPPPVAPPPSGRSRRRFRPRAGWVTYVLLVWLVFLVAVPILAWQQIDKVDATPSGKRPAAQPGTTYLLVGSDSRSGLTRKQRRLYGTGNAQGRRTDTIMLLHTGSGPNLLMSIPRDSLVDVPGRGRTKINAAFAYGGPKLLVRTIEDNTGIRIDDYVEIGFAGFVDVVDAVGGITICPKQAMKDKLANLDVKKGCQDAEGKVALGYARSRHTSTLGDIARAQRQREVVSAVGRKAASPWTVVNPLRYYRLAFAGSRSLRVGKDTTMFATLRFAWAMTRVNGKNGLTCGVPISDLEVNWDPVRSKRLFKLIEQDRTGDIPKSLCRQSGLQSG